MYIIKTILYDVLCQKIDVKNGLSLSYNENREDKINKIKVKISRYFLFFIIFTSSCYIFKVLFNIFNTNKFFFSHIIF